MISHWFNKPKAPDWWEAYREKNRRAAWYQQRLSHLDFLVLDTETTGLRPEKDRILSIGLVPVKKEKIRIQDCSSWYWAQEKAGGKAAEIHGILPKTLHAAGDEKERLRQFASLAAGKVWVAHHAAFDRAMLQEALKRNYPGMRWENPILNTAHLHRVLIRSTAENPISLDDLCHYYRIPLHGRHTAEGDAFMTALVFLKMLRKMKEEKLERLRD